jgi:hypothetical protein
MRKLLLPLFVVAVLLTSVTASAQPWAGDMAKKPWSTGLLIGMSVGSANGGSGAAFAMEIPLEYTFAVGPGNLALHFSFLLHAAKDVVVISFPLGARYKMQVLQKVPLYVYPLFDIGPSVIIVNSVSAAAGWIRFGGGVSYMVIPWLELMFEPLGLGAGFTKDGGGFVYTLLVGAQAHF